MIKIIIDKNKSHLEIDGVTKYEMLKELAILIYVMKTDKMLREVYPISKELAENVKEK